MFAITRTRSPLADLQGLNRLVDEAFRTWPGFNQEETPLVGNWLPPVDILEDKDAVQIAVELPGVKEKAVHLSIVGEVLSLRGQRVPDGEVREENYHRIERWSGPFERHVQLPIPVQTDKVRATYRDGVLEIRLPKGEEVKPREIKIEVG